MISEGDESSGMGSDGAFELEAQARSRESSRIATFGLFGNERIGRIFAYLLTIYKCGLDIPEWEDYVEGMDEGNKIAFVAGATGYTGQNIVRALRRRGFDTIAHIRPDSSRLESWREEFIAGQARVDTTPWDVDSLQETLRREAPALVFSVLGTTRSRARKRKKGGGDPLEETYQAIDYGLTRMLIQATREAQPSARFVYLSALGAAANTRTAYMRARWQSEEALRESGLSYTIVRPAFISGADRQEFRPLERVGSVVFDGLLALLGLLGGRGVRQRYRSIRGPDLAEAMVDLALDPHWDGKIAEREQLVSTAPSLPASRNNR